MLQIVGGYIDSREVAEMIGKQHKNLVRDIDHYIEILGQNSNLSPDSYFVKSTYTAGTGKNGIQFTAAYIERFHEMESQLQKAQYNIDIALNDLRCAAKTIEEMFHVKSGIALSKAASIAEQFYGVNLSEIKELMPPAKHETGYLNPTVIGERIGGMKARDVNLRLAGLGLQHHDGKCWRLSAAGKEYGEYTRNGHSDYQIRWNEKVLPLLGGAAS